MAWAIKVASYRFRFCFNQVPIFIATGFSQQVYCISWPDYQLWRDLIRDIRNSSRTKRLAKQFN